MLGAGGLASLASLTTGLSFLMIFEGRTQALGIVLGGGRPVSFGGDCFWRQCESLMTRFLGAVAVSTSSSSGLWATGVLTALWGRSGLLSTDFLAVCEGFQLGLSSSGLFWGVVGGLGEAVAGSGGGVDAAEAVEAVDAPGVAGSTSTCHRLILSRTLAGLFMPMAFAKSFPFIVLVVLSGAPLVCWPALPFFFCPAGVSGSVGSGEAGIESRSHWSWRGRGRRRCVLCVLVGSFGWRGRGVGEAWARRDGDEGNGDDEGAQR